MAFSFSTSFRNRKKRHKSRLFLIWLENNIKLNFYLQNKKWGLNFLTGTEFILIVLLIHVILGGFTFKQMRKEIASDVLFDIHTFIELGSCDRQNLVLWYTSNCRAIRWVHTVLNTGRNSMNSAIKCYCHNSGSFF